MLNRALQQALVAILGILFLYLPAQAAKPKSTQKAPSSKTAVKKSSTKKTTVSKSKSRKKGTPVATRSNPGKQLKNGKSYAQFKKKTTRKRARYRRVVNYWDTPTYADSAWGDLIDGEDLTVRNAAVQALGPYNGTVVVADAATGRVLTMVNQRLALTGSYQPCSTIKLITSLAALREGIIDRETRLRLSRWESMNMTMALARSNNMYFVRLGDQLGYERVFHYGRMFGLGEKAGLGIVGETPGLFPDLQPRGMRVGIMTAYGEGIEITPLQLTSILAAIANGGTLYYLQWPRSQEDVRDFTPEVKRKLNLDPWLGELKPGMMGAVDFGSGRRAALSYTDPLMGKTGTCTDGRTHLGWFSAYNEFGGKKLVVTVLLTGGAPVKGPVAAGIVGQVFKNLADSQYLLMKPLQIGVSSDSPTPVIQGTPAGTNPEQQILAPTTNPPITPDPVAPMQPEIVDSWNNSKDN